MMQEERGLVVAKFIITLDVVLAGNISRKENLFSLISEKFRF